MRIAKEENEKKLLMITPSEFEAPRRPQVAISNN